MRGTISITLCLLASVSVQVGKCLPSNSVAKKAEEERIRVLDQPEGSEDQDHRIPQGNEYKDYSNWSLVRLYPIQLDVFREILDGADADPKIRVFNERHVNSHYEIDMLLSPEMTVQQLVSSHSGCVKLCSLNSIVRRHRKRRTSGHLSGDTLETSYLEKLISYYVSSGGDIVSGASCSDLENCKGKEGSRKRRSLSLLNWVTLVEDIGRGFLPPMTTKMSNESASPRFSWNNYHGYNSIVQYAKELNATSKNTGYIKIGTSIEDRDLFAFVFATKPDFLVRKYEKTINNVTKRFARHVSRNTEGWERIRNLSKRKTSDDTGSKFPKNLNEILTESEKGGKRKKPNKKKKKYIIIIEAGAHAREWISPSVAMYFASKLAIAGSSFLKNNPIIIVPLLNPDGYEYSRSYDRFWRKNRRRYDDTDCVGVDLNRNFDVDWGNTFGASNDPCSEVFYGTSPFSEPETTALLGLTKVFIKDIKAYFSAHSYGQYVLWPWGYTMRKPPRRNKVKRLSEKLTKYLNEKGSFKYTVGQSSRLLYQSPGISSDYMYDIGIPFSCTVELPNTSSFQLPPEDIRRVAEGFWSAFVCFVGEIVKTRKARSFCNKRIVTATTRDNITVNGWVNKTVPEELAQQIVLAKFNTKLLKNKRKPKL